MTTIKAQAQRIFNTSTKIPFSLGKLEETVCQICQIQNTLKPQLKKPVLVLAASDHGIASASVTHSPSCVSGQMFSLFASGNGACSILCKENNIEEDLIDVGLFGDFSHLPIVKTNKLSQGTKDFSISQAMTKEEALFMFSQGEKEAQALFSQGTNTIILGEMGVGNSTCASALMAALTGLPAEKCTSNEQKVRLINKALELHSKSIEEKDLFQTIACFGGYELVFLAGVVNGASKLGMVILNDGFITTVSVLISRNYNPKSLDNVINCHLSAESGHKVLLDFLGQKNLVDLSMHLGEGTGALTVFPIIKQACSVFNNLQSFQQSGVACPLENKRLPFALGTSSYIIAADIIPNVKYLLGKVNDIELVLFESKEESNIPSKEVIKELAFLAKQGELSYTVHLPYDVEAGSSDKDTRKKAVDTWLRIIELTMELPVHGYVVHLTPESYGPKPAKDVPAWIKAVTESMAFLRKSLPKEVHPSLICIETLSYDLNCVLDKIIENGFSLTLDVGHLWLNGLYSSEYVKKLLPLTRIIHLHGVSCGVDHKSLKVHDVEQLKEFLNILRQFERQCMVVTLEIFSEPDLKTSLEVLHNLEAF